MNGDSYLSDIHCTQGAGLRLDRLAGQDSDLWVPGLDTGSGFVLGFSFATSFYRIKATIDEPACIMQTKIAVTQHMLYAGHITHVSDTTSWTALYRAAESACQDTLFNDPLAKSFAGEQGRAIVAQVPRMSRGGW